MKICDIVQSYTRTSGGIRTYIEAKRDWLRECGRDRHVLVVPGPRDAVTRDGDLVTYEIGARCVPGYAPYRFSLRFDKVQRILAAEQPDIIEVACPYVMPLAAFRHRDRHPAAAVVGTYHTDYPTAYAGSLAGRVLGPRAARLAETAALRHAGAVYSRCDLTVATTRIFADKLAAAGVRNVLVSPLGVDLNTFHPGRRDPDLWSRLGLRGHGPVLIYAGRLDREKRPDVLAAAFRRLPAELGARLVLAGDGALRSELAAAAAGRADVLVLPYEPDRRRLAVLLASADLYVTAGPHETFGLSVLEAQACGLPVVGVRAGALVERVPPAVGLLARPGDPDSVAELILRCLADDPVGRGRQARRWIAGEFGWRHVFGRLCEAYRAVAARRAAARRPSRSVDPRLAAWSAGDV